jgi:methionyl-tRNA formyltransferase
MDGIVLYLNGQRGISVLRSIVRVGHGVMCVVVPTKNVGKTEFREACKQCGVSLKGVENVNSEQYLASFPVGKKPRLGIICGFPTIFKAELINQPQFGTINLHAGKLPQYRGGSPLNWQLIQGEKEISISVIQVDEGIDTGIILTERSFPVAFEDDIDDVHKKANKLFPILVEEVLKRFDQDIFDGRSQIEVNASYWHQRNNYDGLLDWNRLPAEHVHNLVRAITRPYPGAFTYWGSKRVRIYKTNVPKENVRGVSGRVCWIQGKGPFVVCADKAILLIDYIIEGSESARLPLGARLDSCSRNGLDLIE